MGHVTWPRLCRDSFSCVGWDLLCSTYISNLKCLRLTATKKWKAMPNVNISPVWGLTSQLTVCNWRLCQLQSYVTKKQVEYQKSGLSKISTSCPSLGIRGQLPATTVNGGGDSFWKRPYFRLWRARDLDLGSSHTAYRRALPINLYLHAKFHWNRRNFLWTDKRMDIRNRL